MTDAGSDRTSPWPVELRGVTESIVTTRGPNGRWNVAALGLHAGDPVTAVTWGDTRTRRNFEREGAGFVHFARDPELFVTAALDVHEVDSPRLDTADAQVEVEVDRIDATTVEGTRRERWALRPVASDVERRVVPTTNRGYNAVVEATVAASRLDVDAYDTATLVGRLQYFDSVVDRCGGDPERRAFARLTALTDWKSFDVDGDPSGQNESF
ncbi:MAG TPA: DUF447 domain-containing protein [Natrialbaceae archaeon]|nr:DUF447 domain-containing protein [Natrialbaceae archaeon]